jgi:hypothetical protein
MLRKDMLVSGVRTLILALAVSSLAACEGPVSPSYPERGHWVRTDGRVLTFTVTRGPKGAWIVETHGTQEPSKPANACWNVFVGTMTGARLVSSSDLDRDFAGHLNEESLSHYTGLFIDFNGERATVSGPEADHDMCILEGDYVQRSGREPRQQDGPGPLRGPP